MIKEMVQWTGPDKKNRSKTFYFDLTEYEVAGEMKLEELHARFQKFQDEVISGEQRNLTAPEIRELLDMIKVIIRYAYGELRDTDEGAEMWKEQQDPNIWNRFVASGGFNAFIWKLFDGDGSRANAFMENIWPDSYSKDLKAGLRVVKDGETAPDAPDDGIPSLDTTPVKTELADDEYQKPWDEMTKDEIDAMSDEEFDKLVERSKKGNSVPYPLIAIGMARKTQDQPES